MAQFWATGFWADGFWEDNFWEGMTGEVEQESTTYVGFHKGQYLQQALREDEELIMLIQSFVQVLQCRR